MGHKQAIAIFYAFFLSTSAIAEPLTLSLIETCEKHLQSKQWDLFERDCSHAQMLRNGISLQSAYYVYIKGALEEVNSGRSLAELQNTGYCLKNAEETLEKCKAKFQRLSDDADVETLKNNSAANKARLDLIANEKQLRAPINKNAKSSSSDSTAPRVTILKDLKNASQVRDARQILLAPPQDVQFTEERKFGDSLENVTELKRIGHQNIEDINPSVANSIRQQEHRSLEYQTDEVDPRFAKALKPEQRVRLKAALEQDRKDIARSNLKPLAIPKEKNPKKGNEKMTLSQEVFKKAIESIEKQVQATQQKNDPRAKPPALEDRDLFIGLTAPPQAPVNNRTPANKPTTDDPNRHPLDMQIIDDFEKY